MKKKNLDYYFPTQTTKCNNKKLSKMLSLFTSN